MAAPEAEQVVEPRSLVESVVTEAPEGMSARDDAEVSSGDESRVGRLAGDI